eukprot:CAMPEP_0172298612 /NCGR_PEP_ID=MMETSP1058-20130122/1186_1 /TAXON_ID=83371 /ORGANISM="Detonula confervacea, Strain CCMP 353" /LENGTH=535 /DNA_ID=CAMNT_0013007893 /DNA_START=14 /DNA_END=1618 /DNA_ORIENTATION=+
MRLPPYYCVLLLRSLENSSAFQSPFIVGRSPTVPDRATGSRTIAFQSNPLKSLFGNVASSISNLQQQGMTTISDDPTAQLQELTTKVLSSQNIGSWDEIRSTLQSKQTPEERNFRNNLAKGIGKPSPLHKLRLFDESNDEKDVRVTLYRDSASWCPYCQKVWMTLEEKRIPYRIEKVNMRCYGDKPASFMAVQPSGNIPVAIIDGVTYNQSNDIMYCLEEQFPDHQQLVPKDPKQRMKAQELLRLERTIFGAWMYWLTSGDSGGRLRDGFVSVLNDVEAELSATKGGFFLGEKVSLVDMMFAPFLERMCASMLFYKGFQMRVSPGEETEFPAVNRWFDAMETLDSYQLTKSDYYTHCWDLPPQLGGCVSEAGSQPIQNAINGLEPGSWHLPLTPNNGGLEPDWAWAGDEGAAKREAVERLSANSEAIVGFAARGAGKAGFPRYGAALADPNAVSNESIQPFVDQAMKIVSQKLIGGDSKDCDEAMKELASILKKEGGGELAENVAVSLAYLRDRTGVPRDMRLPAARQLRAHLNW